MPTVKAAGSGSAMADDPASASNVWMAVLPLISDVGQAEVRMTASGRGTVERNCRKPTLIRISA